MSARQIAGLKILFGNNYKKWSWKDEQLSYTTPVYIAEKIAILIKEIYTEFFNKEKKFIVWDMFAGLGVDSICLSKLPDFEIYGTELNKEIYNLFIKNLNSFQLKSKIYPYHGDCLELLQSKEKNFDIVYFDPPWGDSFNGSKIFDFKEVTLSNGIYVVDLLKEVYTNYTKNIVIKSPLRCNTFENLEFLKIIRIFIFRKHHLKFIFTE